MSGPDKRRTTGPFRLVDVEAERDGATVQRLLGPVEPEPEAFELSTPWQRAVLQTLEDVRVGLQSVQGGQATLESGQAQLFFGQTELTVAFGKQKAAFDALVPRVKKLEQSRKWKVWGTRFLKVAAPALIGVATRYAPEIAKELPAVFDFLTSMGVGP
jgi:hypothetical protein